MKRTFRPFTALLLILSILVVGFAGCGNDPAGVSSQDIDLSGDTVNLLTSDYVIVYSKDGDPLAKDMAVDLQSKISKITGTSLKLVREDKAEVAHEITIGKVARRAAEGALASLKENEYILSHQNGKLVIAGGSDKALEMAYDKFLETFLQCKSGTDDDALPTLTSLDVPVNMNFKSGYKSVEELMAETNLIPYPAYDEAQMPRDYDYTVRVSQGEKTIELPIYNAVTASDYFNSNVDNGDQHRRFCEFAFSGEPVTIEVTVNMDFKSYSLMPSSKQYASTVSGNVITYTLDKPATTVLKVNDDRDTMLAIFAEMPEMEQDIPDKNDPNVIYFEAGYHEPENGLLFVDPGKTCYLEPGALVRARVQLGDGAALLGKGSFVESQPIRVQAGCDIPYMCVLDGNNTVSGVKFLNALCYNITTGGSNIAIDNVKVLSNQISTDGFAMWGSGGNITIQNSYWAISDNVFVLENPSAGDVNITDCIVASDYAIFFPQHSITDNSLNIKNLDVLRCGSFFKNNWNPNGVDCAINNMVMENVYCVDVDTKMSTKFIWMGDMGTGAKNITMKNVSAPRSSAPHLDIGASCADLNLVIDNVWVGDNQFTATSTYFRNTMDTSKNNKITFTDASDKAAVFLGKRSLVMLGTPYVAPKVYVGRQRVPTKVPATATHVSAYEVVKLLGFTDVVLDESTGKLTFKDGDKTYTVEATGENKFENGRVMVPLSFFSTIGSAATYEPSTKAVTVQNIFRSGNLLHNGDFEGGVTNAWATRNFTTITDTADAHGGDNAILNYKKGSEKENGIYQDVGELLRQHGRGTYRISAWVKRAGGTANTISIGVSAYYDTYNVPTSKRFPLTDSWQKIEFVYNCTVEPTGLVSLFIGAVEGNDMQFIIDDVEMVKVS